MKNVLLVSLFVAFAMGSAFSQYDLNLFKPVAINSVLFNKNDIGRFHASINNYGMHYGFAGQYKGKLLMVNLQHNPGTYTFDPLHFNRYVENYNLVIQKLPSNMLYMELGIGKTIKGTRQKMSWIVGIGREFRQSMFRYFAQYNLGWENRLIDAGASVRTNYAIIREEAEVIIEPSVNIGFKIWNFRIVHQFGVSIPTNEYYERMKPCFSIGVSYVLSEEEE